MYSSRRVPAALLLLSLGTADSFVGPAYSTSILSTLATCKHVPARLPTRRLAQSSAEETTGAETGTTDGWPNVTNGEGQNATALPTDESLPTAPALTFQKFITMQEKRVPLTIRYSGLSGLRPYFLTVAKKIKETNPDVVVEKLILPDADAGESTFEVLVDGKVVVGKGRMTKQTVRRSGGSGGSEKEKDFAGGLSVYVSMEEIDLAIAKARRRRRPSTTVYAQNETETENDLALRLETLRQRSSRHESWKD